MRNAQSCRLIFLALIATATGWPAFAAQPDVLDAQAPTQPLTHQAITHNGEVVAQPGNWKAANQAVAEFPRGHADVIRWEARQQTQAPQAQQPAPTHHRQHGHHHHGGKP